MSRRHIVIAATRADVVIVTPLSPYAARGIQADAITVTSSMHDDPRVHDLIADAEPALIGSEPRPQGAWDAMLRDEARTFAALLSLDVLARSVCPPPPSEAQIRAAIERWRRERGW